MQPALEGRHPRARDGPRLRNVTNVLTLGGGEVKNVAILLEHVDLLNAGDGLDLELLESSLELGILTTGALGLGGHLTTGGTLTACVVADRRWFSELGSVRRQSKMHVSGRQRR